MFESIRRWIAVLLGADAEAPWGALGVMGRLMVPASGWARATRLADIVGMGLGDLLVLYSLTEALSRFAEGQSYFREILLFAFGLALSRSRFAVLADRTTEAFAEAVRAAQARVLRGLGALDLDRFEALSPDQVLMRLTADAELVVRSSVSLVRTVNAVCAVGLTLAYLASVAVGPAILCAVLLTGLALSGAVQGRHLGGHYGRCAARRDAWHQGLTSMTRGFKQVRQHAPRRHSLLAELHAEAEGLRAERVQLANRTHRFEGRGRALFQAILVLVAFGLSWLFPGDAATRPTVLVTVFYVFKPLTVLFQMLPGLNAGVAALSRLDALEQQIAALAAAPLEAQPEGAAIEVEIPGGFASLDLQRVRFAYPARLGLRRFEVGPLDFTLAAGETVFVTGANGSGKSTLLKVLTGLYPRQEGALLLNGVPLPASVLQRLRERIAVIFTEPVLFDRLHGLEHLPVEVVNAMLEDMEIGDAVRYDGVRLSTLDLSTGQTKRLAMALARLAARPVLVLDEWAADQDPVFRARFYQRLLPDLHDQGHTVLAVTHDDDFFHVADRRLHLQDGVIVPAPTGGP